MLALVIMSDEGQVFSSRKALAGVNLAYGMANELLVDVQLAQFVPEPLGFLASESCTIAARTTHDAA
jgi:hypothetical protein